MIRARRYVFALTPALLLTAPAPLGAWAQVKVDPGALDQLAPPPAAKPAAKPVKPPTKPATTKKPPAKPPTKSAPPPPPKSVVPPAPPAVPALPPPIVVPARPVPPPPPVPVKPDAKGEVSSLPANGLRVTFGADSADLNPATDQALRAVAHAAPATATLTVTAYAGGTADDPSTPRRLSLSRALAARAVLISEGVASIRIFVRALGAGAPAQADGPPDRVDVTLAAAPAPAPASAP